MKVIKSVAVILITALFAAVIFSCGESTGKIGPGTMTGNTFKDDYFNVEMQIPDGFYICSDEEIDEILNLGAELLNADEDAYDYSKQQVIPFFYVFEKDPYTNESADYNMNIVAQSEKLSLISSISVKNETDYLNLMKNQINDGLTDEGIKYTFYDIADVDIDGKKFYKMESSCDLYGLMTFNQAWYCYKQDGYIMSIAVAYDPEMAGQEEIANNFISNIKFN